jgi:B9 domain-containing protein 1
MFCRYTFSYGPDWRIMQGVDHGISQVAQKGDSADASIVWNFPIDVTFKSTNAHGWPRLVISVYSQVRRSSGGVARAPPQARALTRARSPRAQDMFGRYVIRGYGSVLVPTVPGRYVRTVRTFAPVSSTALQAALGWLTGHLPEFYDSRFAAANEGREVVRVASTGVVRVAFNVMSRGMASHGYGTGGPPDAPDLDAEGACPMFGRSRAPLAAYPPPLAAAFVAGLPLLPLSAPGPGLAAPSTTRFAGVVAAATAAATKTSSASSGPAATSRPPLYVGGEGRASSSGPPRVREVEEVAPGGEGRGLSASPAARRLASMDEGAPEGGAEARERSRGAAARRREAREGE